MASAFEEAFKLAAMVKAAKSARLAPVHVKPVRAVPTDTCPVDDWAVELQGVTALPVRPSHPLDTDLRLVEAGRGADRAEPPAPTSATPATPTNPTNPYTVAAPLASAIPVIAVALAPLPVQPQRERQVQLKRPPVVRSARPKRRPQHVGRYVVHQPVRAPAVYSPPHYPHLRPEAVRPAPPPDSVKLVLSPRAALKWHAGAATNQHLLRRPLAVGRQFTLAMDGAKSTRELVLGLDFGTSSTKMVMGDRALKQAFAVPFQDVAGIEAFLLPARLYRDADGYSLHRSGEVLNDLKLSLMADPDDLRLQERVVAYLALAIREARAWLFTAHAETYAGTQIVWTLALGQPADQATPGALTQVFDRMARAAWSLSAADQEITSALCQSALQISVAGTDEAELEVVVMPEIAAQVFGFVNSSQFDPKARNIFLLADVGAGTVDACLFRALPVRGGSWSFEVYTSAVEPTGVMNLHRHRVGWWQRHLSRSAQGCALIEQLDAIKLATEHPAHLPESYADYLSGVGVELSGKESGPDQEFFEGQLMRQLRGRTLYKAFGAQLLPRQDLGDVPFFLCGGGSRLGLYRRLCSELRNATGTGFTWLSAKSRELAIPDDLRADGLMRSDYDRLSVAYGLSMLNLANVSAASQMPRLETEASDRWRSHYIDKDQV